MATNVIMPSLGFDMTQGKLLRWLKKEGDAVKKDEPVAEIETEKASVEIQATVSGVLLKILLQPGETVPVGTVMGIIGEANEQVQAVTTAAATVAAPATRVETITSAATALPAASDNGRVKASP
ncbi:MAG TPA: biotin/lipoyl-containing protein, partial [Anaerolineae bacterium]